MTQAIWHRRVESAADLQNSGELRKNRVDVWHVLENLAADHNIEMLIWKWQGDTVRNDELQIISLRQLASHANGIS
jgi:hypothetical protein